MNPAMNDAETKPLSELPLTVALESHEIATLVSQLLHDFKNQLGGLKLYAAVLKKSLANDTLDVSEGIALCDKIMQQIDELGFVQK
jgi:nitrogen-specific signal transduction histidine kinase